jgi:putative Mg2+ transporter-C (MgtC) family protein
MFHDILSALGGEVADLSAVQAAQLLSRLAAACAFGWVLGWERKHAGKAAGRRTHILVAVGAAAFVAVPQQAGADMAAVARVLQGLLAGIGFLGAGCIMKGDGDGHVRGLTTAAGIWLTAGVGAAAGLGRVGSAAIVTLVGWLTLAAVEWWGHSLNTEAEE